MPEDHSHEMAPMIATLRGIGDGWSLLIVYAALEGVSRFDAFQNKLGVARNILSNRLTRLVEEGIFEKVPVREGARRLEYRLTEKGRSLSAALGELRDWGKRWRAQKPSNGALTMAESAQR